MIGAEIAVAPGTAYDKQYGGMLLETVGEIDVPGAVLIGHTVETPSLTVNGETVALDDVIRELASDYADIYPDRAAAEGYAPDADCRRDARAYPGERVEEPVVFLPVFPGTNCDYDMKGAFEAEGARTRTMVFRNLSAEEPHKNAGKALPKKII